MKATIEETGNGFPAVDDYVAGDDSNLYRVVSLRHHRVETQSAGRGNCMTNVEVELADWQDLAEDEEPIARAIVDLDDWRNDPDEVAAARADYEYDCRKDDPA